MDNYNTLSKKNREAVKSVKEANAQISGFISRRDNMHADINMMRDIGDYNNDETLLGDEELKKYNEVEFYKDAGAWETKIQEEARRLFNYEEVDWKFKEDKDKEEDRKLKVEADTELKIKGTDVEHNADLKKSLKKDFKKLSGRSVDKRMKKIGKMNDAAIDMRKRQNNIKALHDKEENPHKPMTALQRFQTEEKVLDEKLKFLEDKRKYQHEFIKAYGTKGAEEKERLAQVEAVYNIQKRELLNEFVADLEINSFELSKKDNASYLRKYTAKLEKTNKVGSDFMHSKSEYYTLKNNRHITFLGRGNEEFNKEWEEIDEQDAVKQELGGSMFMNYMLEFVGMPSDILETHEWNARIKNFKTGKITKQKVKLTDADILAKVRAEKAKLPKETQKALNELFLCKKDVKEVGVAIAKVIGSTFNDNPTENYYKQTKLRNIFLQWLNKNVVTKRVFQREWTENPDYDDFDGDELIFKSGAGATYGGTKNDRYLDNEIEIKELEDDEWDEIQENFRQTEEFQKVYHREKVVESQSTDLYELETLSYTGADVKVTEKDIAETFKPAISEEMVKDAAKVFNVPADASWEVIRKIYKDNARLLHPDKNKSVDAIAQYQEFVNAYEILRAYKDMDYVVPSSKGDSALAAGTKAKVLAASDEKKEDVKTEVKNEVKTEAKTDEKKEDVKTEVKNEVKTEVKTGEKKEEKPVAEVKTEVKTKEKKEEKPTVEIKPEVKAEVKTEEKNEEKPVVETKPEVKAEVKTEEKKEEKTTENKPADPLQDEVTKAEVVRRYVSLHKFNPFINERTYKFWMRDEKYAAEINELIKTVIAEGYVTKAKADEKTEEKPVEKPTVETKTEVKNEEQPVAPKKKVVRRRKVANWGVSKTDDFGLNLEEKKEEKKPVVEETKKETKTEEKKEEKKPVVEETKKETKTEEIKTEEKKEEIQTETKKDEIRTEAPAEENKIVEDKPAFSLKAVVQPVVPGSKIADNIDQKKYQGEVGGNTCWAFAITNALKSKGVKIEPEELREMILYYSKSAYDDLKDDVANERPIDIGRVDAVLSDYLESTNLNVFKRSFRLDEANATKEGQFVPTKASYKDIEKRFLNEIRIALRSKSAVALRLPGEGHYVTVVGMTERTGKLCLMYKDSLVHENSTDSNDIFLRPVSTIMDNFKKVMEKKVDENIFKIGEEGLEGKQLNELRFQKKMALLAMSEKQIDMYWIGEKGVNYPADEQRLNMTQSKAEKDAEIENEKKEREKAEAEKNARLKAAWSLSNGSAQNQNNDDAKMNEWVVINNANDIKANSDFE